MLHRYDGVVKEQSLWGPADTEAVARCKSALLEGDLGLALLAVEGAPTSTCIEVLDTLKVWASTVRCLLERDKTLSPWQALQAVLVERHELVGDAESFYDPKNCHLSEVIERRQGMPILLSSVWLIVARMAGLDAVGIGMPGHFIIRLGGKNGTLVDPFGQGRILSVDRCATMVRRLSELEWQDSFLDETTDEGMVERVVRNLQICHHRQKERLSLYRMARFNALLSPELPAAQLLHAQVAEWVDLQPLAIPIYRMLMSQHRGTEEALLAADRIKELELDGPEIH